MMVNDFLLVGLVIFFFSQTTLASNADSYEFTERLRSYVNHRLGVEKMQSHLDSLSFSRTPVIPEELLATVSESLNKKFTEQISVVRRIRDEIEQLWMTLPRRSSLPKCCSSLNTIEIDTNFQQKVNRRDACLHGQGLNKNPTKFLNDQIIQVMKENLHLYPSIKFQYVGTEEGVTTVYPRFKSCSSTYDPRFRPWYVEAATPESKDVVVVIDTSGSMSNPYSSRVLMDIAKEAANTVITTLNPNDRVGIVSFSDVARTATGGNNLLKCKRTELALATPQNKKYLKSYVNNLRPGGSTFYRRAFSLAFDYFNDSDSTDKVILFLTDGLPADGEENILNGIADRNAKLKNSVVILTYGLAGSEGDEILSNIAKQIYHRPLAGEIQLGIYTRVEDPNNLRTAMGSFYDYFSKSSRIINPIFTVPYYDAFGLGLITSICLPFYYHSNLKGVTCVDMSMEDLLSDIAFLGRTDSSYAFIIDPNGRLLMHPLLPSPQSVNDDPIFLQVTSLETSPQAEDVLKSMLRGESGKDTFGSLRVISRGDTILEGSISSNVESVYTWNRLSPNNFSLCVVTVKSDFETVLSDTSNPSQNFYYHRLDLETVPGECEYLSATATIDHSVVLLSPAAFEEPYLQVIREETVNDIESYRSYFTGGPATYPGFKEFVFDYVAASAYFDDIMVGQADGLLDSVVWAYVGFKVGVFRLYPGTRLAQEYDALKRPWYKRAITQKGRISFSIPYEDAFGAGAVITMSKTLLAGRADNSHDDSDPIVGVMGLDFTMNVFYYFMTDAFPECADPDNLGCFIVDDGGFVVMHHDWLDLDDKHAAYNVHIAAKEPGVAKILIEENLMHRLGCINHEDRLNQFTWLISMQSDSIEFSAFTIYDIRETNLYVISQRRRLRGDSACLETDGPLPTCVAWTQVQCTCADKFEFNFCQNKPELDTRDSYPPCAAFEDNSLTPLPPSRMSEDLKQCHYYDCESKSKRDCQTTAPCTGLGESCSVSKSKEGPFSVLIIVAIAVGVVAVVLIITWICCCHLKKKRRERRDPPAMTQSAPWPGEEVDPAPPAYHTVTK